MTRIRRATLNRMPAAPPLERLLDGIDPAIGATAPQAEAGGWAADVVRARIADGTLLPGQKLSEERLSSVLGVSRNTLREAFRVLAGEGVVDRIANRGVFVARPGVDEIAEMYRARRVLEPAAILWGHLDAATLDRLDEIVRAAIEARDRGDGEGVANGNQDFHAAIVATTGSAHIGELMRRLLAEMRLVFAAMSQTPTFHFAWAERNAQLATLLRAGKRERAAAELRAYLDLAEAELLAQLG